MTIEILISAVKLGLVYSLAVLGFSFALRMLAYADLTLEGSFVLGGVVSAVMIQSGAHPGFTPVAAMLAGGLAGMMTACFHCFFRVSKLLSGIISLAILYTLNLRIQGSANESFYGSRTLFRLVPDSMPSLVIIAPAAAIVFLFFYWLLRTNFGLYLRACGENERAVSRAGYDRRLFIFAGLLLSNAAICLSGALFSQYAGFSDVGIGGGLIVICLTSLMIGEIIVRPSTTGGFLLCIVVGSILCQGINSVCLRLDLHPSDYKGVVGIALAVLVFARRRSSKSGSSRTIGADVL